MALDRDKDEERAARIDALVQQARQKLAAIRARRRDAKTEKAASRQAKAGLDDTSTVRRRKKSA